MPRNSTLKCHHSEPHYCCVSRTQFVADHVARGAFGTDVHMPTDYAAKGLAELCFGRNCGIFCARCWLNSKRVLFHGAETLCMKLNAGPPFELVKALSHLETTKFHCRRHHSLPLRVPPVCHHGASKDSSLCVGASGFGYF